MQRKKIVEKKQQHYRLYCFKKLKN